VLIPSGFAETGNVEGQKEIQDIGRKYNVRLMGPNIYGFYYTHSNLCATFCTAYDVKGSAALSSQSGGIGMAIIGFSRSAKMGVSAIVGLGNKSDIDEDDLLCFFEQDDNTQVIAQHCEDLKDGRAFAEVAKRVSKKKPVIMLKAGRTSAGAKAAVVHTGALAGNDKIYEDVLKQSGVIRAARLRDMLEYSRGIQVLPTPKGENVVIITGAGGSGVLLSDACVDNEPQAHVLARPISTRRSRSSSRRSAPSGNPVDITGGEPPKTYQNTVKLGPRGRPHRRAHPRLLAHHRHAADGVRQADRRGQAGDGSAGHPQADGGIAGRRRAGGRSRRVPVCARRAGVCLFHRDPGGGAG
jgi:acyl-CoA synthetase (NDP forming)